MSHLHVEVWSPDQAADAALTSIEERSRIIATIISLLKGILRLEEETAAIVAELREAYEALKP